jgi:cell division septation protein DedD
VLRAFPTGRYADVSRRRVALQADHFSVQTGVFSRGAGADALAAELREGGLPAFVRREARNGQMCHVVLVGRHAEYEAALRTLARVRGYVPGAQLWP